MARISNFGPTSEARTQAQNQHQNINVKGIYKFITIAASCPHIIQTFSISHACSFIREATACNFDLRKMQNYIKNTFCCPTIFWERATALLRPQWGHEFILQKESISLVLCSGIDDNCLRFLMVGSISLDHSGNSSGRKIAFVEHIKWILQLKLHNEIGWINFFDSFSPCKKQNFCQ